MTRLYWLDEANNMTIAAAGRNKSPQAPVKTDKEIVIGKVSAKTN